MNSFDKDAAGDDDSLKKFLNALFKDAGLSEDQVMYAEADWDCGFKETDENKEGLTQMRSNILRTLFLSGAFERALTIVGSHVASEVLDGMLDVGPVSRGEVDTHNHLVHHICVDLLRTIGIDAIEPYVSALYDQGRYQPNVKGAPDFLCMESKQQAD